MKQLKRHDYIESDILELLKQVRHYRKEKVQLDAKIKTKLDRIKKLKKEVE